MLKARLSNGVFVLGLDAENVKRLTSGQPIVVKLDELGGTDNVIIMAGETVSDIRNELEKALDYKFFN